MNHDFLLNVIVHLSYHTFHVEGSMVPSYEPSLPMSAMIKYQKAHDYLLGEQPDADSEKMELTVQLRRRTDWSLADCRDFLRAYLEVHDTNLHYIRRQVPGDVPSFLYVVGESRIKSPWPVTHLIEDGLTMTRGEARRLYTIMHSQGYASDFRIIDWQCAHLDDPPVLVNQEHDTDRLLPRGEDDIIIVLDSQANLALAV